MTQRATMLFRAYAIVAVLTFIFVAPLIWMLVTSFKTPDAATSGYSWWPNPWDTSSYDQLLHSSSLPVLRWFVNSVLAGLANAALIVAVDAPAAYALARMEFFAKKPIFAIIIYRLLYSLKGQPELDRFTDETLARLLDRDRGGELRRTLAAYLESNGSPTEAALRLKLHRNTVLYRLSRIEDLLGVDLRDADARLTLHLALRIQDVLES